MRILVICEKLDINLTSAGVGRSKLIYSLSKLNCRVDVLFDQWSESEVDSLADVNFFRLNKTPNKWTKLKNYNKIGALYNYIVGSNFDMLEMIQFWTNDILKRVTSEKYDFVYVLSSGQQFYTFFAMGEVYKNVKLPFVLNIHDPYPSAIHPEFKRKIGWIEKKRYDIVKNVIQEAFKVTLPSELLGEYLEDFYPIKGKRVTLPHIGVELPQLKLKEKQKSKKLTITHTGLLLSSRNPKYFLRALKRMVNETPDCSANLKVNIIGPYTIDDPETLELFEELKQVVNFSQERIEYSESMQLLQDSDVLFVFDFIGDYSPIMLGKLGDYLYFNKPILALTPKKSETSRILGTKYPLKAEVNNEDEIFKKLKLIYKSWQKDDFEKFDLSEQKKYVSVQNTLETFQKNIIDDI